MRQLLCPVPHFKHPAPTKAYKQTEDIINNDCHIATNNTMDNNSTGNKS